jgi:hypothetical protein
VRAADRISLADWRRRVAELYVEVRRLARTDPTEAREHWRTTREQLYRDHPQSPVPPAERPAFRLRTWPYDDRLRFDVPLEPIEAAIELPMSIGGVMPTTPVGRLVLALPDGERALTVYWLAGYADGLFLPFRDATNGAETYGAGRYLLDTAKSADLGGDPVRGTLVVDLNFAYHPSCAFDPRWACPLAPPDNRMPVRVEAGERLA